ncbi:MAG: class I SAM-dependent methyltransferase [Balneolaceae bacterium]|nr:class I SAM-dependent methyltransferase [Balneolaceae bacterium]
MKQNIIKKQIDAEVLKSAREIYKINEGKLEQYIDLLLSWNEKINLVSRTVSRETVREHVIHSLIPVALNIVDTHKNWIDAGSGGGLPGIPLAICCENSKWILNDNVKKKMRAADDIIQGLGLKNAGTAAKSISLIDIKRGTGIVTKHAFKIEDLLRLLNKKPWEKIIMWKGAVDAENEIRRSKKRIKAQILEFSFGAEESFYEGKAIVVIEK